MIIFFAILTTVSFGLVIAAYLKIKHLERLVAQRDGEITSVKQESERTRRYYESEALRIQTEAQQALANAQTLLDQERGALAQESARVRQHYESEARRIPQWGGGHMCGRQDRAPPSTQYNERPADSVGEAATAVAV